MSREIRRPNLKRLLTDAENQFKLAVGLQNLCANADSNVLTYARTWSFGMHIADHDELSLSPEAEERASGALVHCATYLLAVQLDSVLQEAISNRFNHSNSVISAAAWIARLIRNAFAHNPLYPVWKIDRKCRNKLIEIPGIIRLDTSGREGNCLKRMDYGGPLALLKLSSYVRQNILNRLT